MSRIFYRCVDWNKDQTNIFGQAGRRIFYRCVDWNPYREKWIYLLYMSHLLQMRGLKPTADSSKWIKDMSHLLQMRGLKLVSLEVRPCFLCRIFYRCVDWNRIERIKTLAISVASFTDAWIETIQFSDELVVFEVASFTDAWIETKRGTTTREIGNVASFTDAWIETCKPALKTRPLLVASFTDAWIETNYRQKEHRHH